MILCYNQVNSNRQMNFIFMIPIYSSFIISWQLGISWLLLYCWLWFSKIIKMISFPPITVATTVIVIHFSTVIRSSRSPLDEISRPLGWFVAGSRLLQTLRHVERSPFVHWRVICIWLLAAISRTGWHNPTRYTVDRGLVAGVLDHRPPIDRSLNHNVVLSRHKVFKKLRHAEWKKPAELGTDWNNVYGKPANHQQCRK